MNLKTIFTYKTDRSRPVTIQRRALRLLAGFLVFMLACTLLSRAADSLTVAQVTTEKPARRATPAKTGWSSNTTQSSGENPSRSAQAR